MWCDRRSNLTNTTLAEPPLLAARTYAGGLRRARLLTSLSFSCRRAPCRGRGEGVCSVLARVANLATTLVCRHRVAQIGPEMPTTLLRFPLSWSLHFWPKRSPHDPNNLRELSTKLPHGPQLMLALTASRAIAVSSALPPLSPTLPLLLAEECLLP